MATGVMGDIQRVMNGEESWAPSTWTARLDLLFDYTVARLSGAPAVSLVRSTTRQETMTRPSSSMSHQSFPAYAMQDQENKHAVIVDTLKTGQARLRSILIGHPFQAKTPWLGISSVSVCLRACTIS